MADYVKTDWVDGTTVVSEALLEKLETGVDTAHDEAHAAQAAADAAAAAAIPKTIVDAKGDQIVASAADTVIRKAVGTDGQVWTADAASAGGIKWAVVPVGSSIEYDNAWAAGTPYTAGDVVIHNGIEYLAVNPSTGSTPPAVAGGTPAAPVVGYSTTLPGSPLDGQEHILVDSITNPTYQWRFRYNAGNTTAYKWEFVGGPPKLVEVLTDETATSLTYVVLATPGPSYTVPRAGVWDIEISFAYWNNTSPAAGLMSYDIGATGAVDVDAASCSSVSSEYGVGIKTRRQTLTAGTTAIVSKYKISTGTGHFLDRMLKVVPVRVA